MIGMVEKSEDEDEDDCGTGQAGRTRPRKDCARQGLGVRVGCPLKVSFRDWWGANGSLAHCSDSRLA